MLSEKELDVGRKFGTTCFFVYQLVKSFPNITRREVETETGLSHNSVYLSLKTLLELGLLERTKKPHQFYVYRIVQEKVLH